MGLREKGKGGPRQAAHRRAWRRMGKSARAKGLRGREEGEDEGEGDMEGVVGEGWVGI